jgi:hexosaminidase
VILSYSSHLYLDHPQEPDPEERGLYWSTRYTDTRKVYSMISNNIYAAEEETGMGKPNVYKPNDPGQLPLTAPHNIIGEQG